MKKFIAIAALLTTLAGCSASQAAAATKVEKVSTAAISKAGQGLWNPSSDSPAYILSNQHVAELALKANTTRVITATNQLEKYVGKRGTHFQVPRLLAGTALVWLCGTTNN